MKDKSDDSEIIEAIRSGNDNAALTRLYKTALPKIIRFITQNNGDLDEAKDIFQDSVIALYNTVKLNKYDDSKELTAFIFHVARNLWINRIKKRNKQFSIENAKPLLTQETPYAYMVEAEKQLAVDGLMEKIGSPCKELLRLVMYEKLTMKDVAEQLGFAGETVAKSTHYRCKQKLAALIFENKNLLSILKE